MKRALLTFGLLWLSLSMLMGARSNILGQNLDDLDIESDYQIMQTASEDAVLPGCMPAELDVLPVDSRILFRDDKPVKRFDRFESNDGKRLCIIAETDLDSGLVESAKFFDRGLLKLCMLREPDGNEIIEQFEYDDNGLLQQVITKKQGLMISIDFYHRAAGNDSLAMVRTIDMASGQEDRIIIGDSWMFADGKLIDGSVALDMESEAVRAEKKDEGLVVSISSPSGFTTQRTIDAAGLVTSSVIMNQNGSVVSIQRFEYSDGGMLVSSSLTEGNRLTQIEYLDGDVSKETVLENGIILFVNEYESEERRQTLYEAGKAYAIVVYDSSTGRIKKVEYI